MLPITIRKGGESTKEEVSVGRERDDEGCRIGRRIGRRSTMNARR
jgi:hypothetical protein